MVRATDLMVGDKVYWATNVVMFVLDVRRSDKTVVGMVNEKELDPELLEYAPEGIVSVDPSDLNPIPLTPEILERNGFKYDGMADWKLEGKDGLFIKVCPVQPNNDDWWHPSSTGFEVNNSISDILLEGVEQVYVHQFQHALTMANVEMNLII